MSIKADYLV